MFQIRSIVHRRKLKKPIKYILIGIIILLLLPYITAITLDAIAVNHHKVNGGFYVEKYNPK